MELHLTDVQCRVLGGLLEKELAVPSTYPMTLKSVVAACNQTTGRDPVMGLDEHQVRTALDELRGLGLVRQVHPSHGARTTKYRQVADEVLALGPGERAVLTLLVLRGDQTPGELRSRAERLHEFESLAEVVGSLGRLEERDVPLVVEHPRRPGQKEVRWGHLLGQVADAPTGSATGAAGNQGAASTGRASGVAGLGSAEGSEETEIDGGGDVGATGRGTGADARVVPSTTPPAIGSEHALLAPLVGTWRGEGDGQYPSVEAFRYAEEIEIAAVPGKPVLSYRSRTSGADGRGLHAESGWFRIVAPGEVELVVAQAPGIVEVAEGPADVAPGAGSAARLEVVLASTLVGGSTTSVDVLATERRYVVEGDTLTYELAMSAAGQPATNHLRATLHRS